MSNLRDNNPFQRNNGIHKDQLTLVDHGLRRHSERMECSEWEGRWNRESEDEE
jgi:hypothetical protein